MEIKIDIDMNKIDYESITKEIREKISQASVDDIFKRYYTTEDDIRQYIENILRDGSERYIVNRGWCDSNEAKKYISNEAHQIIEKMIEPVCEEMINQMSKEDMQNLIVEIFPSVFCDILYKKIEHTIYGADNKEKMNMQSVMRSIVDQAFRSRL